MIPVIVYTSKALFALDYRLNYKDTYSEALTKILPSRYDKFIDVT